MSNRQSTVLMLAVGAVLLRLALSGKFGRAWGSLWGPSSSGGGAGGAAAGSASSAPSGSGAFGLTNVQRTQYPTAYLAQDRAVVPGASKEVNYILPAGSREPVYLPPGNWTEITSQNVAGVGGEETWWNRTTGAILGFLHLSSLGSYQVDQVYHGGPIGTTGWPTDPRYGFGVAGPSNAHLAVVANPAGERYLG